MEFLSRTKKRALFKKYVKCRVYANLIGVKESEHVLITCNSNYVYLMQSEIAFVQLFGSVKEKGRDVAMYF